MFSLAIISTVLAYVMVFNFIFHWIFKERNPIEMIFINILGFVVYGIFAYTSLLAGAVAYFSGYPTDYIISALGDTPSILKLIILFSIAYIPMLMATMLIVFVMYFFWKLLHKENP